MRNFGTYFDAASKQVWTEMASPKGTGLILRSIKVDYKFVSYIQKPRCTDMSTDYFMQPMTWPDQISVFHKLRLKPDETTESIILDVIILSESKQRPAARCFEDVVVYDYNTSNKATLPNFMLDQFRQTYDLQEAFKAENVDKIRSLLTRVRSVERGSWDRPDGQEDQFNSKP